MLLYLDKQGCNSVSDNITETFPTELDLLYKILTVTRNTSLVLKSHKVVCYSCNS